MFNDSHKKLSRLDMIGLSASTICAIHCALMPFVIVMLPLIGLEFVSSVFFEITLIAVSVIIGSITLKDGFFKHHGSVVPFSLFIFGLAIILFGHVLIDDHNHGHGVEHGITYFITVPTGALLIGLAHFLNIKKVKSCKVKHKTV